METKKITQSIDINATKERIWDVLTDDELSREWMAAFGAGNYAVTDWKTGSKVTYRDDAGNGMIGEILISEPGKSLAIEYIGMIMNNEEDYDSKDAESVKGGIESYVLTETDGKVNLSISSDMDPEYFEMMSTAWENALAEIKKLSEK